MAAGRFLGWLVSTAVVVGLGSAAAASASAAVDEALQVLDAGSIPHPVVLDGEIADWAGVEGVVVPLSGTGGADRVEMRAAVHGDRLYVLAIWDDPTADTLHKPYAWDPAVHAYAKTDRMEDRFAVSLRISGAFSANKLGGGEFVADVWHWKAHRSNPAGIAHDKIWRVSRTAFDGSRAFETADGGVVHLRRYSDAGDQLYKPTRHYIRRDDLMPSYEINAAPEGSIADISAKGVWRNGRWYLEMSRALDTGHADDAVIPASGTIEIAVAVFDGVAFNVVDGGQHSVSRKLLLRTSGRASS